MSCTLLPMWKGPAEQGSTESEFDVPPAAQSKRTGELVPKASSICLPKVPNAGIHLFTVGEEEEGRGVVGGWILRLWLGTDVIRAMIVMVMIFGAVGVRWGVGRSYYYWTVTNMAH